MIDDEDDTGDALFPTAAARPTRPGSVAAAFSKAVTAGRDLGTIVDEDEPLVEGTLVMAETLDTARRVGGLKGGYLAAQAFPPFQRGCHALRLPRELTAVTQPGQGAEPSGSELPSWLGDHLGPS